MSELLYHTLNLCSPIFCTPLDTPFFHYSAKDGELIMAFRLPLDLGIEPDRSSFLDSPLWIGKAADGAETRCFLPGGLYFFSQVRNYLDKEACTELALEVHKEGLWQRKNLGGNLYIRYLYEDGSPVTQVWREIPGDSPCGTVRAIRGN